MRLAVASLIYKLTTPESKGGGEVWVSNFVAESARRNHQVDLYAIEGSLQGQNINLIPSLNKPVSEYYDDNFFRRESLMTFGRLTGEFTSTVYTRLLDSLHERLEHYDFIIDSTASPVFTFNTRRFKKPVLTIGHDPPDSLYNFYAKTLGWPSNNTIIFPSQYQYARTENIPSSNKAIVPHGIELVSLRANEQGGEHLAWMSRIDYPRQDKGAHEAILVANKLRRELRITGLVESETKSYVEKAIKPLITSNIIFEEQDAGTPTDKNLIFGSAKLFLFPTQWEESFGLVMLESMACGTPVVAYARGAVPEIVVDGETGFVVNPSDNDIRGEFAVKKTGIDGLCEAVERVYAMGKKEYEQMRTNCRAHVEKHFTVERMVDQYEELYEKILK